MDKKQIISAIITDLEREFDNLAKAAMDARDEATNEESKPENEYDTRAIEASYLAGAQAKRANELRDQILYFKNLQAKAYGKGDAIGSTALVKVEIDSDEARYLFLVPSEGGKTLSVGDKQVLLISLDSPIGHELQGQKTGHTFSLNIKNNEREYEILSVE